MASKPSVLQSGVVFGLLWLAACPMGTEAGDATQNAALPDGTVVKRVLDQRSGGESLLQPDAWRPWGEGFQRDGDIFVCDNGADSQVQRGASQTVVLDQAQPAPLVATAWSKAESVGGSRNSDYSLYLWPLYTSPSPRDS